MKAGDKSSPSIPDLLPNAVNIVIPLPSLLTREILKHLDPDIRADILACETLENHALYNA